MSGRAPHAGNDPACGSAPPRAAPGRARAPVPPRLRRSHPAPKRRAEARAGAIRSGAGAMTGANA